MADVKFEVMRQALSTATAGNTQDFTISGFGTPKAAIFIVTNAVTDDTIAADAILSIGFTDGTNEAATGTRAADGGSLTEGDRYHSSARVIVAPTGTSTELFGFSFNSWTTDGVTLDIDVQSSTARLCTCILIGGSDVSNAFVSEYDDLGTGTSPIDIDFGVGNRFQPDLVFMTSMGPAGATPTGTANMKISFGVGINDGADTQRVAMIGNVNGSSTNLGNAYIGNDSIVGAVYQSSLGWDAVIGSYDANGFSITPNSSSASSIVFYLALKFTNSPDIDLFDMSWPTTGDYAETTPGFTPSFGMIVSNAGISTRNTSTLTGIASLAVSSFDGNGIYTQNVTDEDGVISMNCQSLSSDQLRIIDNDGSTDYVIASSYAFDSSGWDFTLSTNPGSAVLGWGLAIGAGSTGPAPGAGSISITGYAPTVNEAHNVSVGSGSLTLTGYAPTVTEGTGSHTVTPDSGALTLTGYAPTVTKTENHDITVGSGSLTLTGYAPSLGESPNITVGSGSLTLTGYAPTVNESHNVSVGSGSLTLTGYAPTLNEIHNVSVGAGSITITGYAPTLPSADSIAVGSGTITLTGAAPLVNYAAGTIAKVNGIPV